MPHEYDICLEKQNIKLKQKIRFADNATIFLAKRRSLFFIEKALFAQFFFTFCKIDVDADAITISNC